MKFYDREKDLEYFKKYFLLEPNSILFVYGPKSSGKSTILIEVIKELSNRDDIVFFYYDLRKYATPTKEEFLEIFFEKTNKKYVLNKLEFDLKVFRFGFDFNNNKEISLNDFFTKINESINSVVRDGKRPVLIIDELQKLRNIYFNGGKSLLNELFNLFIHLTKVKHIRHVVCLTSDTLFIEEIYRNSTLENTSEYYLIDWLDENTLKEILRDEGFNDNEINLASKYISLPYEIAVLKDKKKLGISVEETIRQWINIESSKIKYLIDTSDVDENQIYNVLKKFNDKILINYKKDVKKKEIYFMM